MNTDSNTPQNQNSYPPSPFIEQTPETPVIGIYQIYCVETKKNYIGQSKDIQSRWQRYRSGKCHNSELRRDFVRYGLNSFEFYIVEECSIQELNEREAFWISAFNSIKRGYNVRPAPPPTEQIESETEPNNHVPNHNLVDWLRGLSCSHAFNAILDYQDTVLFSEELPLSLRQKYQELVNEINALYEAGE